jgi:hypothetical protein
MELYLYSPTSYYVMIAHRDKFISRIKTTTIATYRTLNISGYMTTFSFEKQLLHRPAESKY